jgi:hypothetical protein
LCRDAFAIGKLRTNVNDVEFVEMTLQKYKRKSIDSMTKRLIDISDIIG